MYPDHRGTNKFTIRAVLYDKNIMPPISPMPKFYVQSAASRWVLTAPDLDGAAIRFAHCVLRDCILSPGQNTSSIQLIDESRYQELLGQFGDTVIVSESGFEGEQTGIFATPEVLARWQKQMDALATMMKKRDQA